MHIDGEKSCWGRPLNCSVPLPQQTITRFVMSTRLWERYQKKVVLGGVGPLRFLIYWRSWASSTTVSCVTGALSKNALPKNALSENALPTLATSWLGGVAGLMQDPRRPRPPR